MISQMRCKVIQYSDQTKCEACGLTWDTNDIDVPLCPDYAKEVHEHNMVDPAVKFFKCVLIGMGVVCGAMGGIIVALVFGG